MKEIYSKEQIEQLAEKLNYVNNDRKSFKYVDFYNFLANIYYDLFDDALAKTGREYDQEEYIKAFPEFLEEIKENTKDEIEYAFSGNKSTSEKILTVIELVKKVNKAYLLEKFKGQIDEQTAERLVEYGYTHGSCMTLQCTLKTLFPECITKTVKNKNFAHLIVELDGVYYDITGASTEKEMLEFAAKEGNVHVDECTIYEEKEYLKNYGRQSYFEYAISQIVLEKIKQNDFQND